MRTEKKQWHSLHTLAVHPGCDWDAPQILRKLLFPFLDWLSYEDVPFIWKMELNSQGHIFFRVCVSRSVSWLHVRKKWNMLQSRNGLIIAENDYLGPLSTDVQVFRNDAVEVSRWLKSGKWSATADNAARN
jgi:hypothetical protein